MRANVLLIFDDDIQTRSWKDWLAAHTSFSKPLYRYEGIITMQNDGLYFTGTDKRTQTEVDIIIYRSHITGLFYGYDDVYNISEVRGLGLSWKPIRITFNETGEEQNLYAIFDYNMGNTNNEEWFSLLQNYIR